MICIEKNLKVDHPAHYQGKIECIDYIASLGIAHDFCLGNAIKYLHRAGKKDGEHYLDDLEKARWYINWMIENKEV